MPTTIIDRMETLNIVEKLGVVRGMTRKARIYWAQGEARPQDFSILVSALNALTSAGIGPMSTLPSPYDALVLVERSPAIVEEDPGTVDITLRYEHVLDGPNQPLFKPASGILFGKGRCSITQKKTNFYYPNGIRQPSSVTFTGSTISGSLTITNITPSTANLKVGMTVTGPNIPPQGAAIVSVDSLTQITISLASFPNAAGVTVNFTGNTVISTNKITNIIPNTTGLAPGMIVTGFGFLTGNAIVSVDNANQITLADPSATSTNFHTPFTAVGIGPSKMTAVGGGGQVMIVVGHTFGPNETGAVGLTEYPGLPNFTMQTGEIDLPYPEANFQMQGVASVTNPWTLANNFIAHINSVTWMGRPPLTWICSEVSWEMLEYVPPPPASPFYKFSFEFQYNNDTWNPVVVFNDKRTGRPPAGVVKANIQDTNGVLCFTNYPYTPTLTPTPPVPVPNQPTPAAGKVIIPAGFWQVPALKQVDFNQQFGALFEGFNAAQAQ